MSECTCGRRFSNGEDYRDHLPCPGTPEQQRIGELERHLAAEMKRSVMLAAAWEVTADKLKTEETKVVFLMAAIEALIEKPGLFDVERLRLVLKAVTK